MAAKQKVKAKAKVKAKGPACNARTPMPERVTGAAAEVWCRLAEIMEACGRLDENTVDAFVMLCWQLADYEEARARVQALGPAVVLENTNGTMSMHPHEKIRQSRARELAAALKEWGLTPASLGRLGVSGLPPHERDEHAELEEFLKG